MLRRSVVISLAVTFLLLTNGWPSLAADSAREAPPNIVLILADDK